MMSQDGISFTDPRKVLLNFGWSHSPLASQGPEMRARLLRAKALSLMYEHPQCPILYALSRRIVRDTERVAALFPTDWWSQKLVSELDKHIMSAMVMNSLGPTFQARCDFERIYAIPISQQEEIELLLLHGDISTLEHEVITGLFAGQEWRDCWDYARRFVQVTERGLAPY
jgi:hypothetical protein